MGSPEVGTQRGVARTRGDFFDGESPMKLEPTILENRFVRLEPIGATHREDLRDGLDARLAAFP